jgi:hypothetical protein
MTLPPTHSSNSVDEFECTKCLLLFAVYIMDLVEHLSTYVSLLHISFIFIHISFDLAVIKNLVLLFCSIGAWGGIVVKALRY